jgi:hypothetical protein
MAEVVNASGEAGDEGTVPRLNGIGDARRRNDAD